MEKRTQYEPLARDMILYALLKFNALPVKAVLTIGKTAAQVYNALTVLEGNGFVKEEAHIQYSIKQRKEKTPYLYLTHRGLKYTLENERLRRKFEWIKDISYSDDLHILGSYGSQDRFRRFLSLSTTSLMFDSAEFDAKPVYLNQTDAYNDDEDQEIEEIDLNEQEDLLTRKKSKLLSDRVMYAYMMNESGPQENRFVDSRKMKKDVVKLISKSGKDWRDHARDVIMARFLGIAKNKDKAILIYPAPAFGITWPPYKVQNDLSVMTQYLAIFSEKKDPRESNSADAIIMVTSPKHFYHIYADPIGKREKKNGAKDNIGDGFNHFYAVPVRREGVAQLERIMNDSFNEQSFIDKAVESKEFSRAKKDAKLAGNLFPLVKDATPVMVLIDMDIKKMQIIEAIAKQDTGNEYGVLCYKWQSEYLARIFPKNIMIIGV